MKTSKKERGKLRAMLNRVKKKYTETNSIIREKDNSEKNDADTNFAEKIISHKKTAVGTQYCVETSEGKRKTISYRELEKNNMKLLNDYNDKQEKLGIENNENDNIFVKRIFRHKKVGGRYHYLLEFSDLTKEFATESMAKIDCNDLLNEYKRTRLNNPKKKINEST